MTPAARAKSPAKKTSANVNRVVTSPSGRVKPPLPLPFPEPEPLPPQFVVQPPLPVFTVSVEAAEPLVPELSNASMWTLYVPDDVGVQEKMFEPLFVVNGCCCGPHPGALPFTQTVKGVLPPVNWSDIWVCVPAETGFGENERLTVNAAWVASRIAGDCAGARETARIPNADPTTSRAIRTAAMTPPCRPPLSSAELRMSAQFRTVLKNVTPSLSRHGKACAAPVRCRERWPRP